MSLFRVCMLAAMTMGAALAANQVGPYYDKAAEGVYDLPEGSRITIEGACEYDDNQMSCWDSSGRFSQGLTNATENYYHGLIRTDFRPQEGQKEQLVILGWSHPGNGVFAGAGPILVDSPTIAHASFSGFQISSRDKWLGWLDIVSEAGERTTTVLVTPYMSIPGTPTRLPFRAGQRVSYGDVDIEVGGAVPVPSRTTPNANLDPNNQDGKLPPLKEWRYLLKESYRGPRHTSFTYDLLDKKGRPIGHVDRNGRVVSELDYLKALPLPPDGYPLDAIPKERQLTKYVRAGWDFQYPQDKQPGPVFNIDPSQVGFIEVTGEREMTILFKNISLVPK